MSAFHKFLVALGLAMPRKENAPAAIKSATVDAATDVCTTEPSDAVMPFDEHLLDRARTQWQFGDWESLTKLTEDQHQLAHHPQRAELRILTTAGVLQTQPQPNTASAKAQLKQSLEEGASREEVARMLIAGVHNNIACAFAVLNQPKCSIQHFESAIQIGDVSGDARLIKEARVIKEHSRMGLPTLNGYPKFGGSGKKLNSPVEAAVPAWINEALEYAPDSAPLLIAAAEVAQRSGDLDSAVRYWQRLASVDGTLMKQVYYERLAEAYRNIKAFPRGSNVEETLRGEIDKYQLLEEIHRSLKPRSYLEVGVQKGRSLSLAKCPAIGVDPMPMIGMLLPKNVTLVKATSDDFFASQAAGLIKAPIDLVFIDGMHLFEYALRDFMNVERYTSSTSLVVIDDIFPGDPAQAERDRRTQAWTGDVWKLLPVLQRYRSDLSLLLLDSYPTGLLCISGLSPNNAELHVNYQHIVSEWSGDLPVPTDIISRKDVSPCSTSALNELLLGLRVAHSEN